MLQHDRQLKIIAKAIEKKIKSELEKMLFRKEELQKEVKVENHSYEKEIRNLAKQIEKIDKELGLDKKAS